MLNRLLKNGNGFWNVVIKKKSRKGGEGEDEDENKGGGGGIRGEGLILG